MVKYHNSVEIKDKKNQLKKRAQEIIDTCKREVRDLTDDETSEIDSIKEQIKDLNQQLTELEEKIKNLRFDDEDEDEKVDEPIEDEPTENETENEPSACNEPDDEDNKEDKTNKRNMKKRFSLVRSIRNIVNNSAMNDVDAAVIAEGNKEARKAGINFQGQIQLPSQRAAVTVTAEGEDVVATDLFDILKPLRAKNVLSQAGAKFMSGLVGNVQVPVMSKSNVTWEGETATAKDGAGTFSHVTLSPKRLTAFVDISKQMIAQDSVDVESAIREDLVNAINSKLEETVLGATAGSATQPAGIFATIKPTAVADFAALVNKESDVEDANVIGECKYILSNKAKAALRSMSKGTKSTQLVYENGSVDGTVALNTSNVAGKNYVYGDFSNLAIGTWGGCDVTVDPYTKAADGMIRIVVNMYVDAQVLRAAAFATGTVGAA
nr:MAG TPA: major capsid protein [Caudoviricetes sp.]